MIKNRPGFMKRDLVRVPREELEKAAKWWGVNACTMSAADPWKSHMALLPIVALLAVNAGELAQWLLAAHAAVQGGIDRTTVYEQAWLELMSETPPWAPRSSFHGVNEQPDFLIIRRAELARLLDEIRQDASVATIQQA
jgi:hypothetical protein